MHLFPLKSILNIKIKVLRTPKMLVKSSELTNWGSKTILKFKKIGRRSYFYLKIVVSKKFFRYGDFLAILTEIRWNYKKSRAYQKSRDVCNFFLALKLTKLWKFEELKGITLECTKMAVFAKMNFARWKA